jgi:hypothetical protein
MVKAIGCTLPLQVQHFVAALAVFQYQVVYHVQGTRKTQQLRSRVKERLITL